MNTPAQLLQALEEGRYDQALAGLYALDGTRSSLDRGRERACRAVRSLEENFPGAGQAALFSGPGRTEIGGNHTDHQHGHVLCGSVDMDMLACAAPNGKNVIRICSEGYPALEVELEDLTVKPEEVNTSAALVRGVAARLRELGYTLSGFDACVTSTVLSGSGLSSSAAYEVLVGNILNRFCCGDRLDPIEIAKVGQYAENVYFGKPCGLMDQMGSSVGGGGVHRLRRPRRTCGEAGGLRLHPLGAYPVYRGHLLQPRGPHRGLRRHHPGNGGGGGPFWQNGPAGRAGGGV